MKIITYFGFTLISILVQFCVMDFIQERLQAEVKPSVLNITSHKKQFRDILREYTNKPHALYYRTNNNKIAQYKNTPSTKEYGNTTLPNTLLETTTEPSSTVYEILYDENITVTDNDVTTEAFYTSTEVDNVTELILFEKKNTTKAKSNDIPKRSFTKDCTCNLLYNVCDVHCCCDSDCTDAEVHLFGNCNKTLSMDEDICYPQLSFFTRTSAHNAGNLFCVAKTNLPERRNKNKYDRIVAVKMTELSYKWKNIEIPEINREFIKKQYRDGDPIWLLQNGSIRYLDLPTPAVNNYCTKRKPMNFLKSEKILCNVRLTDLEMIQILNTVEDSLIISITEKSLNSSYLNCSSLHCASWNVIVCDVTTCSAYNKTLHEPVCNDNECTFIAPKIEYLFYYHDLKIVNASIKLYTEKVPMELPYMQQEINVEFYFSNKSTRVIKLSGNPGYEPGSPVIASYASSNHTESFFNTSTIKNYVHLPTNKNGKCFKTNTTQNAIEFGTNKRIKCLFSLEHLTEKHNATFACQKIHSQILDFLGLNETVYISAIGNPHTLEDEEWIPMKVENTNNDNIYGDFHDKRSRLECHNIPTRFLTVFTYFDQSDISTRTENKILSVSASAIAQNLSLSIDDFAIVLTIDTTFIDITKPPVYEFAGSPQLNIHLPKDFFFPFPSKAHSCAFSLIYILACTSISLF